MENHAAFKQKNLAAIHTRLAPIAAETEIAKIIPSELQGIFVRKLENTVELYCYEPETQSLSECMSRIDFNDPLKLISPYTQTAFVTACWGVAPPKNIYIAGFGGGCLGLLFHHCFPGAQIDGSEVDPAMLRVAEEYFGINFDERFDIQSEDGRSDFESRSRSYDIIIVDVFFGGGTHANHMATQEFFAKCKSKLTEHGVLCVNIIERDPLFRNKIAAIEANFEHCYGWNVNGARVTFASRQPLDHTTMMTRLEQFMMHEGLTFPAIDRGSMLTPVIPDAAVLPLLDADVFRSYQEKMAG